MKELKYFVVDIDGTMTDGGIYYDNNGNELKKFCTKDAAGFFAAHRAGIKIMILTGRECEATTRRMSELKVDYLFQNISNKRDFLKNYMYENHLRKDEVAYVGDDLNDIPPMGLVGYIGCPQDSCQEVKEIADYISPIKGGYGAVRDVIEHVLRESNMWNDVVSDIYGIGI